MSMDAIWKREEFSRNLIDRGWGAEDFQRNQMLYHYEQTVKAHGKAHDNFEKYWRTVHRLHHVLSAAGLTPVILKSRRNYAFEDSNVDVLISKAEWEKAIETLHGDAWRIPSKLIQFKQNMIERSKLKLPNREDDLIPAHFYGAVSWRYQTDVGFLPQDDQRNQFLEIVPMAELCPDLHEVHGTNLLMTTWTADLLIHSAQTAFENYRISLGEAIFIHQLWTDLPEGEVKKVKDLARQYGGYDALMLVKNHVFRVLADPAYERAEKWPHNLSYPGLWKAWFRRARNVSKRNSAFRAAEEMFGYLAFSSMYYVKRKIFS